MKDGIGGRDTLTCSDCYRRREIMAWRRKPSSHGIFVSHLFASSIVLLIQRLDGPMTALLRVNICAAFVCWRCIHLDGSAGQEWGDPKGFCKI